MRRLLLLVPLVAVLLPATAAAKGRPGEEDAQPTAVTWLSVPDGTHTGGGGWLARFSITGPVWPHPVVVVRDERSGVTQRIPAVEDGAGIWAARVRFPHAGDFSVWTANYDPVDRYKIHEIGPPVHVTAPPAPAGPGGDGFPWWIPLTALGLVALAWLVPRAVHGLRPRPAG